jgi:hypothetical protein
MDIILEGAGGRKIGQDRVGLFLGCEERHHLGYDTAWLL